MVAKQASSYVKQLKRQVAKGDGKAINKTVGKLTELARTGKLPRAKDTEKLIKDLENETPSEKILRKISGHLDQAANHTKQAMILAVELVAVNSKACR